MSLIPRILKAYVNLLQSRAFYDTNLRWCEIYIWPIWRRRMRTSASGVFSAIRKREHACRADTKKILARSWPLTGKILSNSRTFEKFSLKNIFKRHIHRLLSFNFFSRQRRRSMRHAFWSFCVAEDSHISARRCLLVWRSGFGSNLYISPGRAFGNPWIVHRRSVSVGRSPWYRE